MGIAVVSNVSLSNAGKSAGAQPSADSGGNDFAALLTQQLAAPAPLGPQLQAAIGFESGNGKMTELAADPDEEDTSSLDASALLAAAGLLPDYLATAKPAQPVTDPATGARSHDGTQPDQAAGILDQLGSGKANAAPQGAAAATGILRGDETANIAAETDSASGNHPDFAATLAAHGASPQQAQSRADNAVATATVGTPLHDSRWSQDFGQKIVWLARNDQQVAQLNINPPQLGPMHITLNLSGDQASALFVSPHAEVRQAIEEAMPHLREVLAGAGINLGQANVGTQLPQQQGGAPFQFSKPSRREDDGAILRADTDSGQGARVPLPAMRGGRGMVDLFA